MATLDPKKATKEEILRGLELLQKEEVRKERIARGEIKGHKKWSEMSEEEKAKAKVHAKRSRVRAALKVQAFDAAVEAGVLPDIDEKDVEAKM